MALKFHMQHDQSVGHENDKIQPGQDSKMAADAKDCKTNKSTTSAERLGILIRISYGALVGPWFSELLK